MKAHRRKICHKGTRKDLQKTVNTKEKGEKRDTNKYMNDILNLKTKDFNIPERRGTI